MKTFEEIIAYLKAQLQFRKRGPILLQSKRDFQREKKAIKRAIKELEELRHD